MNMRKMLTGALACAMALSMSVPAFAANVDTAGGNSGEIPVKVTAAAPVFKVTMPTAFTIDVTADGNVTTADNLEITNLSNGAVKVTDMTAAAAAADGWHIKAYENDFGQYAVDSKMLGLSILGNDTTDEGDIEFDAATFVNDQGDNFMWSGSGANGQAAVHNKIPLHYAARVSANSAALNDATAANVVFTVAWNQ